MNHYMETAKSYVTEHQKQFKIGLGIAFGVIVLILLIATFIYNNSPMKYTYQPVKACDLFTPSEAQNLLGDKINSVDKNTPTVTGEVATSKCSYTDLNPDPNAMRVAAVAVRSAISDKGIEKNRTDFAQARANNTVEDVKDLGESAYFNKINSQLNILDGKKWLILSYGAGSEPETFTLEKAVELAHKVLN